ncbi:hypothetical protein [Candidatus Desulfosporosinus nitrosoreducens]|uniref:hypothetical protein n=1 Tax=Candidatus Desulfosporosinus nitrosoreducens TaxID=3401928 RepID=UPI00280C17F7|nr:hypothetical protein [Desulfosporosinus sp. PR]
MKRLFYILLVLSIIIGLFGCASKGNVETHQQVGNLNQPDKSEIELENTALKTQIDDFHNPKDNPPNIPQDWKIYRYLECGYEIAYPENYEPSISGGHSVVANPEYEVRLSLYSKEQPYVDIDSIRIDTYKSIINFIQNNFKNRIVIDGNMVVNNVNCNIYKSVEENYYYIFLSNSRYIFQISSESKETIEKVSKTFMFI